MKAVEAGSSAFRTGIRPGDKLKKINNHEIRDVLDYKYYSYDSRLLLEIESREGKIKWALIKKPEGIDIGLEFETYLMDGARSCANRCVFCFVDQLPPGMRKTLYFKDDDARLSFLQGNYITLTNLSEREIRRMTEMRISPINVSVHATDPKLRSMLIGNRRGGDGLDTMRRFAEAGITMHCQIVCCPGLNDGEQLQRSMEDLAGMFPAVASVSVVPVGLTKFREKLTKLKSFDKELSVKTVFQVETAGADCQKKYGTRLFYCADELYIKAGMPIPPDAFYEDYPQLENGVGMLRLLAVEFEGRLRELKSADGVPFSVGTGIAASGYIKKLLYTAQEKCANIEGRVFAVKNDFFGDTIDVAGLVTGGDLIRQLKGCDLGSRLLIPRNMLRQGEGVFLDDVTVDEVSERLGVGVRIVEQDGADLAEAFFGR